MLPMSPAKDGLENLLKKVLPDNLSGSDGCGRDADGRYQRKSRWQQLAGIAGCNTRTPVGAAAILFHF